MKKILLLTCLFLAGSFSLKAADPQPTPGQEVVQSLIQEWIEFTFQGAQYGVYENEFILNISVSVGKRGLVLCPIKIVVDKQGNYTYQAGDARHDGNGWTQNLDDLGDLKPVAAYAIAYVKQSLDEYLTVQARLSDEK